MRFPHWRPLGAALVVTLLLPLSVVLAQQPLAPAREPAVLSFTSNGQTWAWLHGTPEETRLLRGTPGQPGQELARGKGWREVALAGTDCWILTEGGELLRVPAAGGQPQSVLQGLRGAGSLQGSGSDLYWLEVSESGNRPFYVPAAGPVLRLRRRTAAGQVQNIGSWPGGARPGPGDLVGLSSSHAHVRVRRLAGTELVRMPLSGGPGERLAAESGLQSAVLSGGTLYWTAPSEEASPGAGHRMARRRAEGGPIEDVTEWLPGSGDLLAPAGGPVLYAGPHLYRLPVRFGPSEVRRKLVWGYSTVLDGNRLVLLSGSGPEIVGEAR